MSAFLPFALPDIDDNEINEVVDSLRSGWLTTGPKTKRFEIDFVEFLGGGVEAVAVNSATAGLHLALEAIGIEPGDEVITTTYTFTATAEVIRYLGADPVLVDIDPATFNIDPAAIEKAITTKTKAIVPVHFAGLACNMDAILKLAKKHDLKVIEDAAHAIPTTSNGTLVGALQSDATVYSFYVTKTLATGEGGMVVTRNPEVAARCRVMRLHGISRDVFDRYSSDKPSWYYEVVAPGFKYNMTDIAASLGIHQLKKVYSFQKRRAEIAQIYDQAFASLPVLLPPKAPNDEIHAWHLYILRLTVNAPVQRDRFIELMAEAGIGCSVHFIPLHMHPYWRDRYNFQPDDFPQTLKTFETIVSLPVYTRMTDADIERVVAAVRSILGGNDAYMTKRIFDLFWVIPGLLLLSPILLLTALWIKIDSPGPVFFKQVRVGKNRKEFKVFKFRTMVPDAEKLGLKITVGGDARITRSGHFLRKYKLDELPQLFNVLFGDMSLVGPRPEVPEYVDLYPDDVRDKVLSVQPGITDLASLEYKDENELLKDAVNPRETYIHEIMPRKLDYYMQYVDQRTLWFDFNIILRTIIAIIV